MDKQREQGRHGPARRLQGRAAIMGRALRCEAGICYVPRNLLGIAMTVTLAFFLWFLFVCGLKLALQVRWARALHARHGAAHTYDVIFRKIGRAPFGRRAIQPDETLDPAFRADLQAVQSRSALWDTAICLVTAAGFGAWLALA
jgi:hypothetical protein